MSIAILVSGGALLDEGALERIKDFIKDRLQRTPVGLSECETAPGTKLEAVFIDRGV